MEGTDLVGPALAGLAFREEESRDGMRALAIEPALAREICARLREKAGFDSCTFVTAIDFFPAEPRFEVVWQLLSVARFDRVRLKARVASADPRVPTVADLYPGAAFMERECFDMFGIRFDGHAGLKRLLMPEDYGHHPLRKDFPHRGIEPDRLYREWDRRRRARGPGATVESREASS